MKLKELKDKYNIKLHLEFDGYLHRLCKLDKKIYDYQHSEVIRGYLAFRGLIPLTLTVMANMAKPQRLNFGDFWTICEALDREPPEVCSQIKLIKLPPVEQKQSPSMRDGGISA